MSIHAGQDNIIDIYNKDQKIARVYKGSDLVWGYYPGEVIFESSVAGTYTINIKCNCKVNIILVGAGGGAASWGGYFSNAVTLNSSGGGGSGAYVYGNISIKYGTYSVVVGAGGNYRRAVNTQGGVSAQKGGDTSFIGNIAIGGGYGTAANSGTGGIGGIYQTNANGINGDNGGSMKGVSLYNVYTIQNISGGASKYNGYGAGGYISDSTMTNAKGVDGYIKIVAV